MQHRPYTAGSPHFYPRPPRGGRRAEIQRSLADRDISIHALREEGDLEEAYSVREVQAFLSTPSARRATTLRSLRQPWHPNFYPRPPRGGRPVDLRSFMWVAYFYPRPPRGGRQGPECDHHHGRGISIHALREEGDLFRGKCAEVQYNFYPRPPRGGRRPCLQKSTL